MDNFSFKKSLGQNFLMDKNIIHNIVDKANLDKESLVIEIGPGGGSLTSEMVSKCGYLLLYEADGRLKDNLMELLKRYDNYSLIIGDFLKANVRDYISKFNYEKLYVVANLPYYITTPIIMKFIDEDILPNKMVLMVQKEVAGRLSASVGSRDYGSLTVFLNYYYNIKKLFDVSKNSFRPKPNVDSAVIEMVIREDRLGVKDMDLFKRVVRDSFKYKRKNIRNNLKEYNLEVISSILSKYGYDLGVRAENLELEIFVEIANALV